MNKSLARLKGEHRLARKPSTETRMTLYRLIGLPSYDAAIRAKYQQSGDDEYNNSEEVVYVAETEAYLYWSTVDHDQAKWTDTVKGLTQKELRVGNSTASAVLIIPYVDETESVSETKSGNDNDSAKAGKKVTSFSAWAITFGMGFQMLEPKYVDSRFGLRVAIRCAKLDGLNVLSKTTLDERPEMVRSTIPSGARLRSFGFEELGDFSTRLVTDAYIEGIGHSKKPIKVRGADSLNIPLSKSPENLLINLGQIKAVLDRKPVSSELASLEHFSLVKNKSMKNKLDQLLIEAIGEKSDLVALSYPYENIDDFGQVGSFKIFGTGDRRHYDYLPTLNNILKPLLEVDEKERLRRLQKMYIILFKSPDDSDVSSSKIPLKKWLTFQKTINNKRYFLQNNRWYVMDSDCITTLQRQVKKIFDRGPYFDDLPNWPIYEIPEDGNAQKKANAELNYNKQLSRRLGGLCLDQQLIRPEDHGSGIEACDVLLPHGVFVHVKNVSSSAPASHLLAQALVSTEMLRTNEKAQKLLEEKIKEIAPGGVDLQKYETKPRRVVIVIAKDDKPITADTLFTFTKINLVRHEQQLASMNVELNIAPVVRKKQPM